MYSKHRLCSLHCLGKGKKALCRRAASSFIENIKLLVQASIVMEESQARNIMSPVVLSAIRIVSQRLASPLGTVLEKRV